MEETMTSARLEAAIQSHRAEYRPAIRCDECDHVLSIAEQIEHFCDRCKKRPVEIREGKQ
jgi:Zn finger protein HypA/HybF involved in hydrogenase expression